MKEYEVGTVIRFTVEDRIYAVLKSNHPTEPWYSTCRFRAIDDVPKRMDDLRFEQVLARPDVKDVVVAFGWQEVSL